MFRDFISKNGRSLTIIGVLIIGWFMVYIFTQDNTADLIKKPLPGQVYIFHNEGVYAPMRLDSVGDTQLFMRNYLYFFEDAIPKRSQILDVEFDLNFYAIYEKVEIERLFEQDQLVLIYDK